LATYKSTVSSHPWASEQVPPDAVKCSHSAKKPDELPERPVLLAAPVAAAKSSVANAPVLAVAADAVGVMAGSVTNPVAAAIAAAIVSIIPTASFFMVICI
jgi:hypothetical protein